MSDRPDPDRLRRRGCALALLVAPGLMLAGDLTQATPARHDTASELASIAAAPGRAELASLLGFLGLVLMVPAFLGLARPLWAARPRLTLIGVSTSIAGLLGLVSLMGSGPVTVAMTSAGADRAEMVALTDRYESSALVGLWVGLMILGYSLGPIVLGVGLWRTGWPWLVPAALGAGLVLAMADAGRWPLAAGFACTWLGMAVVGLHLWRDRGLAPTAYAVAPGTPATPSAMS
jgi:hypothetical protein